MGGTGFESVAPTMSRSSHNAQINKFQLLTRTFKHRQVRTKTEQNNIYRQVSAKSKRCELILFINQNEPAKLVAVSFLSASEHLLSGLAIRRTQPALLPKNQKPAPSKRQGLRAMLWTPEAVLLLRQVIAQMAHQVQSLRTKAVQQLSRKSSTPASNRNQLGGATLSISTSSAHPLPNKNLRDRATRRGGKVYRCSHIKGSVCECRINPGPRRDNS